MNGKYGVLNVIPFNSLEGDDCQHPDTEHVRELIHHLQSRGVLTRSGITPGRMWTAAVASCAPAVGTAQVVELRRKRTAELAATWAGTISSWPRATFENSDRDPKRSL